MNWRTPGIRSTGAPKAASVTHADDQVSSAAMDELIGDRRDDQRKQVRIGPRCRPTEPGRAAGPGSDRSLAQRAAQQVNNDIDADHTALCRRQVDRLLARAASRLPKVGRHCRKRIRYPVRPRARANGASRDAWRWVRPARERASHRAAASASRTDDDAVVTGAKVGRHRQHTAERQHQHDRPGYGEEPAQRRAPGGGAAGKIGRGGGGTGVSRSSFIAVLPPDARWSAAPGR